jgi:hypothetical protein
MSTLSQLNLRITEAGNDVGPFNIYQSGDSYVTPIVTNIPLASLSPGPYAISAASLLINTDTLRLVSTGTCTNFINVPISCLITATPTPTPNNLTLKTLSCNVESSAVNNQNYPTTQPYILGASTGTVTLTYSSISIPDRYIVIWDSNIVIDTKYRGLSQYNFGGSSRSIFNTALNGRIDPLTMNTYPFTHPDNESDGYPTVFTPSTGSDSFIKNTTVSNANLLVYGPLSGTAWTATLSCPDPTPTPTPTPV